MLYSRKYYLKIIFIIFAIILSQWIIGKINHYYQSPSIISSVVSKTAPNEREALLRIHKDLANEMSLPDAMDLNINTNSIDFVDGMIDRNQLDYSKSHPFENSCKFPVIAHDDPDLSQFVTHYRNVDCTKGKHKHVPLVSQHRNGEILIGRPARSKLQSFKCYYIEISGALTPDRKTVQLVGDWKKLPLSRRILIQKDQFVIKCYSGKALVYHNVFAWISDKPRLSPPPVNVATKYSIDILFIDSTSRNQFYRHMPLTLKFLKDKDFQILYGYTKVGDNSAVNLLSVLSGLVHEKEKRGFGSLVEEDGVFDKEKYDGDFQRYPYSAITRARAAGCATMWNDEIATVGYGAFHYYDFGGFHQPIADYYYRPFYEYQYQHLYAKQACNMGNNIIPKWLLLLEQFSKKYSETCHFSFNFMTGLTHASSNNLELYDIPVSEVLERMEASGALDNTFLLLMGDHGQRISPIQETYIGRIEERMPMMAMHVPQKFREEFPDKFHNLVVNKNRLTSNFDIHETLEDILDLTLETPHEDRVKHGISLFEEIPKDRSCADALIPENFCVCMEKTDDSRVAEAEALIKPKLDEYFALTFTNSCISSYSYTINPSRTTYSITKQARYGGRYVHVWAELSAIDQEKVARDIFDIELEVALTLESPTGPIQGTMVARMQYNVILKTLLLNASPMLSLASCPNAHVIENVCDCLE